MPATPIKEPLAQDHFNTVSIYRLETRPLT